MNEKTVALLLTALNGTFSPVTRTSFLGAAADLQPIAMISVYTLIFLN